MEQTITAVPGSSGLLNGSPGGDLIIAAKETPYGQLPLHDNNGDKVAAGLIIAGVDVRTTHADCGER